MSGAWQNRVVIDAKGQMHFAFVRYRPIGQNTDAPEEFILEDKPSGFAPPWLSGKSLEEMQMLAERLLAACKKPLVKVDTLPDLGQHLQRAAIEAVAKRDVEDMVRKFKL